MVSEYAGLHLSYITHKRLRCDLSCTYRDLTGCYVVLHDTARLLVPKSRSLGLQLGKPNIVDAFMKDRSE